MKNLAKNYLYLDDDFEMDNKFEMDNFEKFNKNKPNWK